MNAFAKALLLLLSGLLIISTIFGVVSFPLYLLWNMIVPSVHASYFNVFIFTGIAITILANLYMNLKQQKK